MKMLLCTAFVATSQTQFFSVFGQVPLGDKKPLSLIFVQGFFMERAAVVQSQFEDLNTIVY